MRARHFSDSGGEAPRLVTASTGNHGRALATAARAAGLSCVVFAPAGTPATKQNAIRAAGAELRADFPGYDEAESAALAFAAAHAGAVYVSRYNDPLIVAGTGTIGLEILDDYPDADTILVPVGGGGLISGIATAVKALRPQMRVIGVEAARNPAFNTIRAKGLDANIDIQPTLADALGGILSPAASRSTSSSASSTTSPSSTKTRSHRPSRLHRTRARGDGRRGRDRGGGDRLEARRCRGPQSGRGRHGRQYRSRRTRRHCSPEAGSTIENQRKTNMLLEYRAAPPFDENGDALGCEETREGVIIDPGNRSRSCSRSCARSRRSSTSADACPSRLHHRCRPRQGGDPARR